MKLPNVGWFKGTLATGNGIVTVLYGIADVPFQFTGPFVAGIIRVLLAVSLKVLVALDVFEAVFLVIIDGVVVMHSLCIRCKKVQYIVIIQAFHIFTGMGCITGDRFIPIKPEAGSNNSTAQGRKMVKDMQKLLLRAFNL